MDQKREIKFRCWNDKKMIPVDILDMESKRAADYYNWYDGYAGEWISYESDSKVLMQFTGLRDAKGIEIFEGDILRLTDKLLYKVVFEDGKFVCYHAYNDYGKWGDLHRMFDPDFSKYNFEVIGNIYENPKLVTP